MQSFLLCKFYKQDAESRKCQNCKGDVAILAAITNHSEVVRYIKHLGIEHEAPARAPPRYNEEPFEFGVIGDL
jgi:hypothetical protein